MDLALPCLKALNWSPLQKSRRGLHRGAMPIPSLCCWRKRRMADRIGVSGGTPAVALQAADALVL